MNKLLSMLLFLWTYDFFQLDLIIKSHNKLVSLPTNILSQNIINCFIRSITMYTKKLFQYSIIKIGVVVNFIFKNSKAF